MIILGILCFLLTVALVVACYLIWATQRKLKAAIKYAEWYAGFIYVVLQKVRDVKMEMDIIDNKGLFKADDEVGYTFEALQQIIQDLDQFIKANLETE